MKQDQTIEVKCCAEEKAEIAEAAKREDRSMSKFVLRSALKAARGE